MDGLLGVAGVIIDCLLSTSKSKEKSIDVAAPWFSLSPLEVETSPTKFLAFSWVDDDDDNLNCFLGNLIENWEQL